MSDGWLERHPSSFAREFSLQFLYQMEADKVYYFSRGHFDTFVSHFNVPGPSQTPLKDMLQGIYDQMDRLDEEIAKVSRNWSIDRMATIDRILVRIGTWEILEGVTPPKVVLNEVIELAKKYGTENSGSFVNGILVAVARNAGANKIS